MGQIGIVTELRVSAANMTSVSPHARRAVREADVARRVMDAAREAQELPKGISSGLAAVHARRPFPYSADDQLVPVAALTVILAARSAPKAAPNAQELAGMFLSEAVTPTTTVPERLP